MDLAVYVETIVRGFPRYHKYTIGSGMRALSHKIPVLVVRANAEQDKRASLTGVREALEELKILARIAHELKVFANFNSFECLVKLLVEVSGQNDGWLRSRNPRPPAADGERACIHGASRPPGGGYANYTDWRLPNVRELMSIVDYGAAAAPRINTTAFPDTVSGVYWTSTTYVPGTTLAWIVNFNNGGVNTNGKTTTTYVRCVRGGP